MSIFNSGNMRGFSRGRFAGMRGEAEDYAASLGFTPGGPGWGDAVRDYVLNGPPSDGERNGNPLAANGEGGPAFRRVPIGGVGAARRPAAPPPQLNSSPVPPPRQPISGDALEGMRQFVGGRPGQPRRDTSLGGLFRESQEQARDMPMFEDQPVERQSRSDHPLPGTLPQGQGAPPRARPARLPSGGLSSREETGGRGAGTVSTGVNDPGGISYGSYQLSSERGQVQAFLRGAEGSRWSRELQGAAPRTQEFQRRWQQIAAREPEAFQAAQHDYIGRTHYTPAITAVRENTGVDLDAMPEAVRDAAWSASVQHGTAARVLTTAVNRADARVRQGEAGVDRDSPIYQEALIDEMYDARTALLTRLINSPRTAPGDRSTFRNVIRIRYPRERAAALRQLREERRRAEQAD